MRVKVPVVLLVFCLLLPSALFAQVQSTQEKPKTDQLTEEQAVLEKKAMELIEELVAETQSLRLPENRAHIQATVAEMLWSCDEKRARALFAEAVSNIGQLMGKDTTDPQNNNLRGIITNLRFEIIQLVAGHDPALAKEFLVSTRPPVDSNYKGPDIDADLEMSLAAQIAQNDPKLALQLAEENLSKGLSPQVVDALVRLQTVDKEAAAKLADDIIKKIKGTDLTANQQAASIAMNLLRVLTQPARPAQPPAAVEPSAPAPSQVSSTQQQLPQPAYSEQSIRDLIDYFCKQALSSLSNANMNILNQASQNNARILYTQLPSLMPQIEKYSPIQAQALRARFGQLTGGAPDISQAVTDLRTFQQAGAPVEVLLDAAPKAPTDSRQTLYMLIASRLAAQGELDKARQIANDNIPDPTIRRQMLQDMDARIAMQAIQQGKVEDSRQLIAQARSDEEKVTLYCRLAAAVASKGDKKTATQLLEEARGVLGSRVENINQFNAQVQLATAYAPLDSARAFEIIDPVIDQINALAAAGAVMDSFQSQGGGQRSFKDGELLSTNNNNNTFNQYVRVMGPLARIDFDRAKTAADRFSRSDVKILAHLAMIQGILSSQIRRN